MRDTRSPTASTRLSPGATRRITLSTRSRVRSCSGVSLDIDDCEPTLRAGRERAPRIRAMSSEDPFGGLFGDPEELRRRMEELAESMQGAQKVAWADNAIKLAVDMTVAALARMNLQGSVEQQAADLRSAIGLIFPGAVTLPREAREGFGT